MKIVNKKRFTIAITIFFLLMAGIVFALSEYQWNHTLEKKIENNTIRKVIKSTNDNSILVITQDGNIYEYK